MNQEKTADALQAAVKIVDQALPWQMRMEMDDRTELRKVALEMVFVQLMN